MSRLYDMTSTVCISTYVQFEIEEETQQIVNTSLDGTVYIQNVGSPQKNCVGSVYVTRDEKTLLMSAFSGGNLMRIEVKHGTYYGRIIELSFGERLPGDYLEAKLKVANEVVS